VNYSSESESETDKRTNKWTDEGTTGQVESIMRQSGQSAVGIAFLCLYHAERILSAIAKFIVFGEGRGGVKCEREEVGKKSGERSERVWMGEEWEYTKK